MPTLKVSIATALAALMVASSPAVALSCSGCSCKGGPGVRLPNGHCASWVQNESFCSGTCYPAGSSDERPAGKRTGPPRH